METQNYSSITEDQISLREEIISKWLKYSIIEQRKSLAASIVVFTIIYFFFSAFWSMASSFGSFFNPINIFEQLSESWSELGGVKKIPVVILFLFYFVPYPFIVLSFMYKITKIYLFANQKNYSVSDLDKLLEWSRKMFKENTVLEKQQTYFTGGQYTKDLNDVESRLNIAKNELADKQNVLLSNKNGLYKNEINKIKEDILNKESLVLQLNEKIKNLKENFILYTEKSENYHYYDNCISELSNIISSMRQIIKKA